MPTVSAPGNAMARVSSSSDGKRRMTSLLPDASYCTSELGRLLFQPKSEWSGRAYVVEVKECTQLGVKFIEYTVLIVMVPRSTLELDDRSFVLHTRFRSLNKLHSQLKKLHQQLYLKSVFPPFPETKWIGGNDEATVAERRAGAEQLLTFLLDQDVLRKSRLLHTFIESAEEKAAEGHLVEPSTVLTTGNSILDSPDTIPIEVVPVIAPDSSTDNRDDFQFDDVSIEEAFEMQRERGRGFLKDYLAKLKKTAESEGDNYLVSAGRLVSAAKLAESEGSYEIAFHSYKDAASILIKGMESEKSLATRNAVRLKSAKYLEKAESIYRSYLRYDSAPLFDVDHMAKREHDDVAFRSSNSGLKAFRFVGVLPDVEARKKVFLVEDRETNRLFVMKLLEKRSSEGEDRVFLPTNVPHMVPLVKFFTTTNYIILLLEYVQTGRLWSFLCRYLAESERKYDCLDRQEADEDFIESGDEMNKGDNPYRGRHTRFSVSADTERLAMAENEALEESNDSAIVYSVGEDALGTSMTEEPAKYLLVPSDTAREEVLLQEEAPAPVSINSTPKPPVSPATLYDRNDNRYLSLPAALHHTKRCLLEAKRCLFGGLAESLIVHWSAQCISMLYVLHSHGVVIGDLHPDNLLIDCEGNLVFTYQARWEKDDGCDREYLNGYSAPECECHRPLLTPSADVWSVGALLFELLHGRPLSVAAPHGLGRVCELPIHSSSSLSFVARDLLSRMLQVDVEERATIDQVRSHPFYASVNWQLYDNPHGPVRIVKKEITVEPSGQDTVEKERESTVHGGRELEDEKTAKVNGEEGTSSQTGGTVDEVGGYDMEKEEETMEKDTVEEEEGTVDGGREVERGDDYEKNEEEEGGDEGTSSRGMGTVEGADYMQRYLEENMRKVDEEKEKKDESGDTVEEENCNGEEGDKTPPTLPIPSPGEILHISTDEL